MKKRQDPNKKEFSVDPADAKFPDIPLSVRVSPAMVARMEAAARMLGLDRSEFIRYAIVRLIVKTPDIVKDITESNNYPMGLVKVMGTPLEELPVSVEELTYVLQCRGEESVKQLHDIYDRLDRIDRGM